MRLCVIQVTEQSKYSNCAVNLSKYGKENQGIHFHHHHQACLIHYFGWEQTSLLTYVIQWRNQVRPRYFTKRVRPAWPGQNMTQLTRITWTTRPGFNPGAYTSCDLKYNCEKWSMQWWPYLMYMHICMSKYSSKTIIFL